MVVRIQQIDGVIPAASRSVKVRYDIIDEITSSEGPLNVIDESLLRSAEYQHRQTLKKIKERKKRSDIGKNRAQYKKSGSAKFRSYLSSANSRGLRFDLTEEQFNQIISKPCIYCGSTSKIGIDREDSDMGYILVNCAPCCGTCNSMKMAMLPHEFIQHISRIYRFQKDKGSL